MAIERKKKVCKTCKKERYLFGKGNCENCYKIELWKKSEDKKRAKFKTETNKTSDKENPKPKRKKPKIQKSEHRRLIESLDRVFSVYIRLRDTDNMQNGFCISSGKHLTFSTSDAGHFISRRKLNIRFNEFNVNAQSRSDNRYNQGNQVGYIEGLKKKYGKDIVEKIKQLEVTAKPPDTLQLRAMLKHYKAEVERLKKVKGIKD